MAQRVTEPSHRPAAWVRRALEGRHHAWAEVDLDAIAHNLRVVRRHIGGQRRVMAVVKANAYGHGAVPVARRLVAEGADLLAVAFPEEGLELRGAGIRAPVLVLGAASVDQIPAMAAASLTPTAYSLPFLDALLSATPAGAPPIGFHMKIDTGMGRLGLLPDQLPAALARIAARGRAALEGLFTTLSCSDDPADPHTPAQLEMFESAVSSARAAGCAPAWIHAANSGGVIDAPPSWLETVRPGIMLYGVHPSARCTRLDLRPALSLKTSIALVKRLPAGAPLGYGRSFVTARPSLIGTVPMGYADGLARLIAARGRALVHGVETPIAGRISMDHLMLDLTGIPDAAEEDEVVLIGA